MNATTVLELTVLALGVLALVLGLAWAGRRPSRWDRMIAEHCAATGDYPTAQQWRAGRVGWDPTAPTGPAPTGATGTTGPGGPVTVTVVAVDGRPPVRGTR